MTFIIVCTGTAGHINPGITIADELKSRRPEAKVLFIGTGREMEKRLVAKAGFELINIKMTGFKRSFAPSAVIYNIKTVINVIAARRRAKEILRQENPRAVIGTGGYICYPVLKAAAKLKIPAYIHESNAKPGMTVRKLSGIADKVFITYPGYEKLYKKPERIIVTGTPVRKEFTENTMHGGKKPDGGKPFVLSFWGSLGAEKMNEIMAGFIKRNMIDESFCHVHAAGNSLDILLGELKAQGIKKPKSPYADIRDYIDDLPALMQMADLVLCRAGGITLAELTALRKPAVLVPSPYVPDDVQTENAKQLTKNGAAVMLCEAECTSDILYKKTVCLVKDRAKLDEMSKAGAMLAKPDAVKDIADIILSGGTYNE